jgi:hypothetical protein
MRQILRRLKIHRRLCRKTQIFDARTLPQMAYNAKRKFLAKKINSEQFLRECFGRRLLSWDKRQ